MQLLFSYFSALYFHLSPRGAYLRYVAHQRRVHPEEKLMEFAEFYKAEQERKWRRKQRCC